MKRQRRDRVVSRRRESPLSTVPACVSLLPLALLSEVSCAASRVEIVLDDADDLRWGDARNVARDDLAETHRIIDDQPRQLVTARTVNPDELPVHKQASLGFGRVHSYEWAAICIPRARGYEMGDHEPRARLTDHAHASSLIGSECVEALPTAT